MTSESDGVRVAARTGHEESTAQRMAAVRAPDPTTSARLISAAVELLGELTPAQMLRAIGTRSIAARAGVSAGSIFHHFGSVESFAAQVVQRVFDPATLPVDVVNELITDLASARVPLDASMTLHRAEFDRVLHDPELRTRIGMWAFSGATGDGAWAKYLGVIDSQIVPFMDQLFAGWDRELRPPWHGRSFVSVQSALLVGSVMRHIVEPDIFTRESFVNAAATLTQVSLRGVGQRGDVETQLRQINYYPSRRRRPPGAKATEVSRRERVIDAAEAECAERGLRHTKMAQIAKTAGISESNLYALFATKGAIAAVMFGRRVVAAMDSATARVVSIDLEGLVAEIVSTAAAHPDLATEYLAHVMHPDHDAGEDQVLGRVMARVPVVGGHVEDDGVERFRLVVAAAVRRAIVLPTAPPLESARDLVRLFASG